MQTVSEIRKVTGLSQDKFGAALGIPSSTLRKWEQGARECPPYVVDLIAFRVHNDPLFKGKNNQIKRGQD
jgi:DNA-binding transcriptional regulator YiaG